MKQPTDQITTVKTIAERLSATRKSLGISQADLAHAAKVSPGTIGNIEAGTRQNPRELLAIAAAAGITPEWLKSGKGPMRPAGWPPPSVGPHPGAPVPGVAHHMSDIKMEDAPSVVAWERILKEPLKAEFQTLMPDASMEPDVPRNARVIFVTGVDVEPGDWALVRDPEGHLYLRVIRQLKPGRWEAHALNPAFLPMDSERDSLSVVAVFDGVRGRKARV